MTATTTELFAAALKLNSSDREELATMLYDSLDTAGIEDLSEEEFHAELIRRSEESRKDPSSVVSLEELKRRLGDG